MQVSVYPDYSLLIALHIYLSDVTPRHRKWRSKSFSARLSAIFGHKEFSNLTIFSINDNIMTWN